ncbi:hypothetical protein EKO04_008527 [Ascochyta lentis]|uniref:Uncharacterized protein n=1 Tax=Ascochyta lentis TaxID=205686 RepID=A0A8H7MGD3_9PLEO|nr:hypothetical protein EKO04_008527 [Ascochyta lentis]
MDITTNTTSAPNTANTANTANTTHSSSSTTPASSVFSRRPSFFGGKGRHKASRSTVPPTLHLAPASPIREHDDDNHGHGHNDALAQPANTRTTPPARPKAQTRLAAQHLQHRRRDWPAAAEEPVHVPAERRLGRLALAPQEEPLGLDHALGLAVARERRACRRPPRCLAPNSLHRHLCPQQGQEQRQRQARRRPLHHYDKAPLSALDKPKTPFAMAVPLPLRHPPPQKDMHHPQRQPSTAGLAPAANIPLPTGPNPHVVFQHIHELASKRISTLDYLRKAHEGRIYWFNTLLFSKTDLARLPSFTPRNQSRRATHYLLLGFSLPTILDLHATSPADYLRALNALLLEFEQYQSIHPPDGSAPGSLSRARIPQMFKRANLGGKGRRSSSATGDFPLLTPQTSFGSDSTGAAFNVDSPPTDDLLPNETYLYLQTPSLPFDPDFFSTFATLCDVLIDCYTKMLSMLSTPESVALAGQGVPSTVGDLFSKADARVRKIILAGVVREFEESCRAGVRGEVGGVGKVVLGGLM